MEVVILPIITRIVYQAGVLGRSLDLFLPEDVLQEERLQTPLELMISLWCIILEQVRARGIVTIPTILLHALDTLAGMVRFGEVSGFWWFWA